MSDTDDNGTVNNGSSDERNNNNLIHRRSLFLTTSADEILDVTPVNSSSSFQGDGSNNEDDGIQNFLHDSNKSNDNYHDAIDIDDQQYDDDDDDDGEDPKNNGVIAEESYFYSQQLQQQVHRNNDQHSPLPKNIRQQNYLMGNDFIYNRNENSDEHEKNDSSVNERNQYDGNDNGDDFTNDVDRINSFVSSTSDDGNDGDFNGWNVRSAANNEDRQENDSNDEDESRSLNVSDNGDDNEVTNTVVASEIMNNIRITTTNDDTSIVGGSGDIDTPKQVPSSPGLSMHPNASISTTNQQSQQLENMYGWASSSSSTSDFDPSNFHTTIQQQNQKQQDEEQQQQQQQQPHQEQEQQQELKSSNGKKSPESEWDKALRSGKPFIGRAEAHVFAPKPRPPTVANLQQSGISPRRQGGGSTPSNRHRHFRSNSSASASSSMSLHNQLQPVLEEDGGGALNYTNKSSAIVKDQASVTKSANDALASTNSQFVPEENGAARQTDHVPPPPPPKMQDQQQQARSAGSSTTSSPAASSPVQNSSITITTQQPENDNSRSNINYQYPMTLQHRPRPPMQQRRSSTASAASTSSVGSGGGMNGPRSTSGGGLGGVGGGSASVVSTHSYNSSDHLSAGVLPDVLMTVRQKIESMTLFDSDILRLMSADYNNQDGSVIDDDPSMQESRESLKRSSQQSISASVLVSLAHKRYERRRLAAMEIEKVVRSLVVQHQQQNMKKQQQSIGGGSKRNGSIVSSPVGDVALDRVRAILLLLSDDYVRSTSEDARKGGVVALAACAIGLKKADDTSPAVQECRDLILASVVHACQDHSQRVRYYATESLFNVVKVIPSLAVQHFFILFEILRSLYADVDVDVRSGAELLDKKLKEIIVGAMNAGVFTADACVPVFSRFVFMKHKATKRLTLTWLQELNEKLIGSPILEFLHLFLGGIFDMVADPTVAIRQSALAFLQSVLPKLLVVKHDVDSSGSNNFSNTNNNNGNTIVGSERNGGYNSMFDNMEDIEMNVVDFDKILQSLVTTMEHPNPFVRKVAMYWMSRIVKAHMAINQKTTNKKQKGDVENGGSQIAGSLSEKYTPMRKRKDDDTKSMIGADAATTTPVPDVGGTSPQADGSSTRENNKNNGEGQASLSAASISVRNSVPHVLPGILLSIGDNYHYNSNNQASSKDAFLPDQTTRDLAEQTNACLQEAVRRDGNSYVQHLDGFIVALREELDSPGGFTAKNSPAVYRTPYRMDVLQDGTGIETAGWFRSSREGIGKDATNTDDSVVMSRLCALHWVIVLYESVVPDQLKADYAREFIFAIIHQMADHPPQTIVNKSLEVLAKITIPVSGEEKPRNLSSHPITGFGSPAWTASSVSRTNTEYFEDHSDSPTSDANVTLALKFLDGSRRSFMSRDREVFSSLVQLFSYNEHLIADLSNVVTYMCTLQPPAFVMVSFAVELDRFVRRRQQAAKSSNYVTKVKLLSPHKNTNADEREVAPSRDFRFVSSFIQHLNHVLLNTEEAKELRIVLKDCVGKASKHDGTVSEKDRQLSCLFNILLHAFSHNIAATLSLCLWAGAYRTSFLFLTRINPLDIHLIFLLEIDRLVEMLERPLFRHIHVRMLERDQDSTDEGSGAMLFQFLKCLLMILPQSTCYRILRDRLTSIARFRQTTNTMTPSFPFNDKKANKLTRNTKMYVSRIREVRALHCYAAWKTIRLGSLEVKHEYESSADAGADRLKWLGYNSKEEEEEAYQKFRDDVHRVKSEGRIEELKNDYTDFDSITEGASKMKDYILDQADSTRPVEFETETDAFNKEEDHRWVNFWSNGDK